ncbi:MAG: BrnT family toxin [Lachnospiraceae bacterium]|nr:BrnT family toxin [Lachnospiraceae bacterium]
MGSIPITRFFVVHTIRDERVRMISARLATKQERRFYHDSWCSDI